MAGLRREEVALLAGVSTDYYTRLEQGRERHPSEQVLEAVAAALQMDGPATAYLFGLTRPEPRAASRAEVRVYPQLRRLMDTFDDTPAVVVSPALDVLASNATAQALYRGFRQVDNQARMMFLDPAAKSFYADWEEAARSVVGNLRAASAPYRDDTRVTAVIGELALRSPAFAALWARHDVTPRTTETKHFVHPDVGPLTLEFQSFAVTAAPGQQLFTYTAEPASPSADALRLLGVLTADTDAQHQQPSTSPRPLHTPDERSESMN